MFEQYLAGYNVPDTELRERIRKALENLSIHSADNWGQELVGLIDDSKTRDRQIYDLADRIPIIASAPGLLGAEDPNAAIRYCALVLDVYSHSAIVETHLKFLTDRVLLKLLLFASYEIALDFVGDDWKFLTDPKLISPVLNDWNSVEFDAAVRYWAEFNAKLEIENIQYNHPKGELFVQRLDALAIGAADYVEKGISSVVGPDLIRLAMEGIFKNVGIIADCVESANLDQKDWDEFAKGFEKIEKGIFKNRFDQAHHLYAVNQYADGFTRN